MGFPGGTSGREPAYQSARCRRCRFNPWVRKFPWSRAWQPTPACLPGESHVAWRASVHGVAKSQTQLKQLSMHTHTLVVRKITPIQQKSKVLAQIKTYFLPQHWLSTIFHRITIWEFHESSRSLTWRHWDVFILSRVTLQWHFASCGRSVATNELKFLPENGSSDGQKEAQRARDKHIIYGINNCQWFLICILRTEKKVGNKCYLSHQVPVNALKNTFVNFLNL